MSLRAQAATLAPDVLSKSCVRCSAGEQSSRKWGDTCTWCKYRCCFGL